VPCDISGNTITFVNQQSVGTSEHSPRDLWPRMPSTKAAPNFDALQAQLERRMAEAGEWDRYFLCNGDERTPFLLRTRIQSLLFTKLNESGWTDDLRHRSKGETAVRMVVSKL
jgi:hypothetical protein